MSINKKTSRVNISAHNSSNSPRHESVVQKKLDIERNSDKQYAKNIDMKNLKYFMENRKVILGSFIERKRTWNEILPNNYLGINCIPLFCYILCLILLLMYYRMLNTTELNWLVSIVFECVVQVTGHQHQNISISNCETYNIRHHSQNRQIQ